MAIELSRDKKKLLKMKGECNCVIPNGVVKIATNALGGKIGDSYYENHTLISVVIPNSVRYIGVEAFVECVCLTAIVIPDSVVEIGLRAFSGCQRLQGILLPKNLLRVDAYAFGGWGKTAFYDNKSNWKDGVLYAGCCLVRGEAGVTECKVADGTRVIAEKAFDITPTLASISIPDSVVNIGYKAFHTTALYNDSSKWKDNALYIDHCLIDVKQELFMGEQEVKKGTRVIAEGAFENSFALTGITLLDSLVTIGAYAFRSCTALPIVEVPYGVSYVGESAFEGCIILSSVFLPSSLEYMGMNVFKGCQSLASIKVFATKPPLVNETLGDINKSIPVYVPEESIEVYKAADGWCEFTNFLPLKDKEKKKTASVKEEKVEVTTKPTVSEAPKAEPKHEKPTAPVVEEPKAAAASATSPAKPNLSDVKKSAEIKDYLITQGNDGGITVYRKNGSKWEEADNAKGTLREIASKVSFNYDESWNTRQFGAKLIDFVNKLS